LKAKYKPPSKDMRTGITSQKKIDGWKSSFKLNPIQSRRGPTPSIQSMKLRSLWLEGSLSDGEKNRIITKNMPPMYMPIIRKGMTVRK